MKIQKLRTNHLENPLGYLLDTLSLSWIVSGKNEPGMETKVVVAADAAFEEVLFESDWIEGINALDFQPEISLLPQKRYYWKVIAQAGDELLRKASRLGSRQRSSRVRGQRNGSHPARIKQHSRS